jgi:hypothetical protein
MPKVEPIAELATVSRQPIMLVPRLTQTSNGMMSLSLRYKALLASAHSSSHGSL